jgi:hypothetical protein
MVQSVLIFADRKPGTTPEQFQKHYEEKHMPLIKELAGDQFPLSHTRRYIQRTEGKGSTEHNAGYPATILVGEQADFDCDCCAELVFAHLAALMTFKDTMAQPEKAARVAADEEHFLDRTR